MLSRLPVLAPIGWRIETEDAVHTHLQTATHKTTPSKPVPNNSAEDVFQEVTYESLPLMENALRYRVI